MGFTSSSSRARLDMSTERHELRVGPTEDSEVGELSLQCAAWVWIQGLVSVQQALIHRVISPAWYDYVEELPEIGGAMQKAPAGVGRQGQLG